VGVTTYISATANVYFKVIFTVVSHHERVLHRPHNHKGGDKLVFCFSNSRSAVFTTESTGHAIFASEWISIGYLTKIAIFAEPPAVFTRHSADICDYLHIIYVLNVIRCENK
jgi:predicted transcriptional regulator